MALKVDSGLHTHMYKSVCIHMNTHMHRKERKERKEGGRESTQVWSSPIPTFIVGTYIVYLNSVLTSAWLPCPSQKELDLLPGLIYSGPRPEVGILFTPCGFSAHCIYPTTPSKAQRLKKDIFFSGIATGKVPTLL